MPKKVVTYQGNPASKKEGTDGNSRAMASLERNIPMGPYGNNTSLRPSQAWGTNERGKTVMPS